MPDLQTLKPESHAWMTAPGLVQLMQLIKLQGGDIRFVGGAVRDALLGLAVEDVDLATTLPPERVMDILREAGFKVIPTGFDHGTVMAIADGRGYEITTLRRDVDTDGRHATVAYTDNWQEDAARRDFTINALYADADGTVYDYFGGLADLADRRVRFVGDAKTRINEDVLRLLRYFRFIAQIEGAGPHHVDEEALDACAALAPKLITISAERIWKEVSRLLQTPDPVPAWKLMYDNGVLQFVLPQATQLECMKKLVGIEACFVKPAAIRRLAALLTGGQEEVAQKLRLSRAEAARLAGIGQAIEKMRPVTDPLAFRQIIYDFGVELCEDALLILMAEGLLNKNPLIQTLRAWENPVFPLKGKDVLKLGLNKGPEVGSLLAQVEDWWRAADFKPDAEACLRRAEESVGERSSKV